MGLGPLLAVTAFVSALHAALLLSLAGHGSTPVAPTRAPVARWIVLSGPGDDAAAMRAEAAAPRQATPPRRAESLARAVQGADVPTQPTSTTVATPLADRAPTIGIYRAATALDVPVRARSAPDITMLAGLSWSGLPLRMRLFIDSEGTVVDTRVLQSSESDDVAERVRRMFLATGFTAGVQHGHPVPSYKDIELSIGTPS
jgi:hypothetical protein